MCGIAGFLSLQERGDSKEFVELAATSIKHRGPDEFGHYSDEKTCLLNTRLSVMDIENGHQPFFNENRDIVVVQNGEIYNFIEIKSELEKSGIIFNTQCDTEVILKAYEKYGNECFSKFNGMFAIAILNKQKNILLLARDRLGVKPLYILRNPNSIYFSSEIKTFLDVPDFDKKINEQSIHNYLKFNYVPLPKTIFASVTHLLPAHYIEIDCETLTETQTKYWSIDNKIESEISEATVLKEMDEVLIDAIRIRLRSDVKVGAFLSGGLDSSLMCAMTKHHFDQSLDSFSIGFPEKRFDESEWAAKVAKLCNIPNQIHILDADIISMWEETTWFNDQPHGDISFIPTFVLSKFAASKYKVVITGDGGDEACAGYTKYFGIINKSMRQYFDSISLIVNDDEFTHLYSEDFLSKISLSEPWKIFCDTIEEVSNKDDINKVLYFDTKQLLPGNNLVKPDKMGMANSLEARSPMLDYRFFELMQSISGASKLGMTETKDILKKFSLKYLPRDVVYRDKQMFTVPVGEWFKGKLKQYLYDIINSDSLSSRQIFNIDYLNELLDDHVSGSKDNTRQLRAIANLELWYRKFIDK